MSVPEQLAWLRINAQVYDWYKMTPPNTPYPVLKLRTSDWSQAESFELFQTALVVRWKDGSATKYRLHREGYNPPPEEKVNGN